MFARWIGVGLLGAGLCACGGRADLGLDSSGAETGSVSAGGSGMGGARGGSTPTSNDVARVTAICGQPEAGVEPTPTAAAVEAALVGAWLYCSGARIFSRSDVAGLRFDQDRSWRFLLPDSGGGLVGGTGFNNVGSWSIVDTTAMNGPGVFQVNLDLPGLGGNAVFPVFATTPPKMRLSTMMGYIDYAALDPR